jgi:hypothetical protein
MALDDLRARKFWRKGFTVAVIVICALDGLAFDADRFIHGLGGGPVFDLKWSLPQRGAPFWQVVGEWRSMMSNVFENHGAIGCDEEAPLQRALKLDEGPLPQARLEDASVGRVEAIRWTPNRVEVDVDVMAPVVVSVNENWNEHWRAELSNGASAEVIRVGPKLARDRDGGRLGARAPAGRNTVAFVYRPRSFVIGAIVSALAIPLAIAAWILLRRRRRRV